MPIDWNAFNNKVSELCKHFSPRELKVLLLMLDPTILARYSIFLRLISRFGLDKFSWGRWMLFGSLFKKLFKNNPSLFQSAPSSAISSFNALVAAIFPPWFVKHIKLAPKDEKTSRKQLGYSPRLELLLEQAGLFHDILVAATELPRARSDFRYDNPDEPLIQLETILEARLAKIKAVKEGHMALFSKLVKLPCNPPNFLAAPKQLEKWQKVAENVSGFTTLQVNGPGTFEDEQSFEAWVSEQKMKQDLAHKALQVLLTSQGVETQVREFLESQKTLPASMYKAYVKNFAAHLEEDLLAADDAAKAKDAIFKQLATQKSQLEKAEHEVKIALESLKKSSMPLLSQLFAQDLLAYKDLPKEAERLIGERFDLQGEASYILDDAELQRLRQLIQNFSRGQLEKIGHLVQLGKGRGTKLEEIELFHKDYLKVVSRIKFFKDLQQEFAHLEEVPAISKQELARGSVQEVEELLQSRYDVQLKFRQKLRELNEELNQKAFSTEQRCQDAKLAIKRRLFEIFWNITPYRDLAESLRDQRQALSLKLSQFVEEFYQGKISSAEFFSSIEELAYEHDVVKLRNEVTHRSARLKDLRDEIVRMREVCAEYRRLLEITSNNMEAVYRSLYALQPVLSLIAKDVEDPFQAFAKAVSKDDINYVFRNFWIRIEEVQPKLNQAQEQAKVLLIRSVSSLKNRLLLALNTLEELINEKTGKRPQLVVQAERELANVTGEDLLNAILGQMHAAEKQYRFLQPFSFFMNIADLNERKSMLTEARECHLEVSECREFAKQMQYIKTFEEERVDIILEVFEKEHLIGDEDDTLSHKKEAWAKHIQFLRHAACSVREEVFLDIGLLDRHALMDIEPERLISILKLSLEEAKRYINNTTYSAFLRVAKLSAPPANYPLCQTLRAHLESDVREWEQITISKDAGIDVHLDHLRHFCHYLFQAKVRLASDQEMLLPKCINILHELASAIRLIDAWIVKKRSEKGFAFGKSWVHETFILRAELEAFEPQDEKASNFRVIEEKIFQGIEKLPEVHDLKGENGLPLALMRQELEDHLKEIESLAAQPKNEHPFIYIPGYLAFYDLNI